MADPQIRVWHGGRPVRETTAPSELAVELKRPDVLLWVDLVAPDTEELDELSRELGLDPLAVEDALDNQERAKVDRYPGYLFVNIYAVRLEGSGARLITSSISAFVTERALVTVRQDDALDTGELCRRWDDQQDLVKYGVGMLLHGLIDQVVDGHFAAVSVLDEEIEALESLLFEEKATDRSVQIRSFGLRRNLVMLRRVVLPMREVVNTLMRRDLRVIPPELAPYFQDVYDHTYRAAEWTESLRDLVTTILDTRIALQGNRLNEVMKKVTSWAAIIAVPTAVTGFYGMNVPYPGFGARQGFVASVAVLVVLAVTLYLVFKIKDWL